MYEDHRCFEAPYKESTQIWRYMNFKKFESLLDQKALFFAKAVKFEDPYEGLFSEATLINARSLAENCDDVSVEKGISQSLPQISKYRRELTFLNCWHMSKYESAAMWKIYAKDSTGISIQSSFKNLKESFSESQHTVYIGVVNYIDWNKDKIPIDNYMYPYLNKRKSFECERELRALVYAHQQTERTLYYEGRPVKVPTIKPLDGNGIFVTVSLKTLIEKIYVSPKSSDWFKNRVKKVLKKHDLDKEVIKSDLYNDPVY